MVALLKRVHIAGSFRTSELLAIVHRAEAGIERLPRRNGAIFEPLRHTRHPRTSRSDFRLRVK